MGERRRNRDDPIRDDPINEELGGDGHGLGSVGRDPGGAPGAQHLMGSRPRMVHEPVTVFALWVYSQQLSQGRMAQSQP